MRVITLKQPWATLIAEGYKKYEFRSWQTKYRGPLLIHAGKGIDKDAIKMLKNMKLTFPASKIIAMVNLDDCVFVDEQFNNELNKEDQKSYGPNNKIGLYAWKLSNIKKINNSDYIKGKLGLWNIENNNNLE